MANISVFQAVAVPRKTIRLEKALNIAWGSFLVLFLDRVLVFSLDTLARASLAMKADKDA
jgi:hypothetical protein